MEYYERLYEAVSQHLCGLHQKKGASFLSMGQELGLAKETVRDGITSRAEARICKP